MEGKETTKCREVEASWRLYGTSNGSESESSMRRISVSGGKGNERGNMEETEGIESMIFSSESLIRIVDV
jgi:hypothetical protein